MEHVMRAVKAAQIVRRTAATAVPSVYIPVKDLKKPRREPAGLSFRSCIIPPTMAKTPSTKKSTNPKSDKAESTLISENTKLSLTIPWNIFEAEYKKVLAKSSKQLKLKGFRKGKAPVKVAEEQLSREKLIDQALQAVMPPLYSELIKKEARQPLTNPEFNPVSMDWGKDWVFEVFIAEKPEVKLGDYKKAIKEANKQAATDLKKMAAEHAKEHAEPGHVHTKEQDEAHEREVRLHTIFKHLLQTSKLQVPELLLKEETRRAFRELSQELEQMNLSIDNYMERRGQSFEDLSQEMAAQTLGQLQIGFILDALEKAEKIEASEADKAKELEMVKDEKLRHQMTTDPRYSEYLVSQIRRRNLLNWMTKLS
jgi:FKBP-type peptidyl-prolyl cis-trans isomerase (trigger factor)